MVENAISVKKSKRKSNNKKGNEKKEVKKTSKLESNRATAKKHKKKETSIRKKKEKPAKSTTEKMSTREPVSKEPKRSVMNKPSMSSTLVSTDKSKDASVNHTVQKKPSDHCPVVDVAPKKLIIKTHAIEQALVDKMLLKLAKKSENPQPAVSAAPLDLKSSLVLDRVVKKKSKKGYSYTGLRGSQVPEIDEASFFGLKEKKKEEKNEEGKKVESELKPKESTVVLVKEDSYTSYPKIADVLKLPEEDCMGEGGLPKWTVPYEPTDDDKKDVEEPLTVGSEHITEYHSGNIKLFTPPQMSLTADQWETTAKMMKKDELLFTSQVLFSNTIRSLINVTAEMKEAQEKRKKKKKAVVATPVGKSLERIRETQSEDDVIGFAPVDASKCVYYTRSDPINSIKKWKETGKKE